MVSSQGLYTIGSLHDMQLKLSLSGPLPCCWWPCGLSRFPDHPAVGVGGWGWIRVFQLTHLGSFCGKLRGFACSARPELPPRPEFQQGSGDPSLLFCVLFLSSPPHTLFFLTHLKQT